VVFVIGGWASSSNGSRQVEAKRRGRDKNTVHLRSAIASMQGRRSHMEDAHTDLPSLREAYPDLVSASTSLSSHSPLSYFGVYDGHGGTAASLFAANHLPQYVCEELGKHSEGAASSVTNTPRALTDAVLRLEEDFMKIAVNDGKEDGTTIVLALLQGRTLTVGNVGDSEAVLGSHDGTYKVLSEIHTPHNPSETKRVLEAGGRVIHNRIGHPHWNPKYFSLAVSRAIGDLMYKAEDCTNGKCSGLIADPDVFQVEMSATHRFLLLACDGLWETLNYEDACKLINEKIANGDHPKVAANAVVNAAFANGSTDNITACLVVFDWE